MHVTGALWVSNIHLSWSEKGELQLLFQCLDKMFSHFHSSPDNLYKDKKEDKK